MKFWQKKTKPGVIRNNLKSTLTLPKCKIEQIMPGTESTPVTLIDYKYIYGGIGTQELIALCKIARHRKPRAIFEIGTYLGITAFHMAVNSEARIYTLDLPPTGHKNYMKALIRDPELDVYPTRPGIRFQGTSYADRIHQLFGDSETFDFRPYHGSMDFVFIDGCHHYEFVLRDSQNALRMVSTGGIIIWHDYGPHAPDVVRVLNELAETHSLVHIAGTHLVINQGAKKDF